MTTEWIQCTLGEQINLKRGYDLPRGKRHPGSIPIYSSAGLNGFHNVSASAAPGVVIGRYGTIGESFYIEEDFWPLNTTLYVENFKGNNPKFIYYLLKTLNFHSLSDKSAVPGINRNHVHLLEVKVPDVDTQRVIAEILSCLDEKFELNQKINHNLEQQAQAIFETWLATEISEPWSLGSLSDIAVLNPLRTLKKGSIATYVEMASLPTSGSFPSNWEAKAYAGGAKFQNGDTLLARITPCLENGKTAYVNFLKDGEVAFGSTEYVVLSPKEGYPHELLYLIARNKDFVDYAIKNMSGTTGRQRVSAEILSRYQIKIPPKDFVANFAKALSNIMNVIKHNSFENRTLATLRDTLLPKLMSGEIDVSDVKI